MVAQGAGKIVHIGSTTGFMPGPLRATYSATKAFGQAIDEELREKGVTSAALCLGYVATAFADAADLHNTGLTNKGGATPASVAKYGYDAMLAGKLVTINERELSFQLNWAMPFLLLRSKLKMIRKMQTKTG